MAGIRWRVSRKLLMVFTDWVLTPFIHTITPSHTRHVQRYGRAVHIPAISHKKLTAAFDGGRITSDGGVMLLAAAEHRVGLADRLARLIADPRNPLFVTHSVADILRARMLAIACGYEDADDLDHLRKDPGFKLACGHLPDTGANSDVSRPPIPIGCRPAF